MLSATVVPRRLFVARPPSTSRISLTRTVHGSYTALQQYVPSTRNPVAHGTENYFVDGDDTPPPTASVYKVDATSDAAESAYEPPSGPWSRAGAGTDEYQTTSKDEPYDVPGGKDVNMQYGGIKGHTEDKSPDVSKAGGFGDTERWGRKPKS